MSQNNNLEELILKRIEQSRKKDKNLLDLDLSGIKITKFTNQIKQQTQQLKTLQVIYLVDCNISSLQGFPTLNIVAIDLSRNMIGDQSCVQALLNCAYLQQIIITSNKIQNIETIFKLQKLQKLIQIDFAKNPIAEIAENSKLVFQKFTNMQFVNCLDKNGNGEFLEDDENDCSHPDQDQQNEEFEDDQQKIDEIDSIQDQHNQQSSQKQKQAESRKKK